MKFRNEFACLIFLCVLPGFAQLPQNPVISDFGEIYNIPEATVLPEPDRDYKIVVDVYSGSPVSSVVAPSLNNVARMINLHAIGGVPPEKIDVVLAIHGQATFALLNHERFNDRFESDNPNAKLIEALDEAGVKITLCGQSMIGRGIKKEDLLPEVQVATSMLTTVSTYQLKGYAVFKF